MNDLGALNTYLFDQLDRLSNEDLDSEELEREIKRADALTSVAESVLKTADIAYKTMVHMDEYGYGIEKTRKIPQMLEVKQ